MCYRQFSNWTHKGSIFTRFRYHCGKCDSLTRERARSRGYQSGERESGTELALAPVAAKPKVSNAVFAWLLILPAAIFIAVIVAWPLVETVRLSFTDARLGGENYVGVENYQDLLESKKFGQTVVRTFYWMILSVSLKLVLGLAGASLLNAAVPGKALFRVLVMPPWVIRSPLA